MKSCQAVQRLVSSLIGARQMKRSPILLIIVLSVSSLLASGKPEKWSAEKIFAAASTMMKDYRVWIEEKSRKSAIQSIGAKDLPDDILKLGFKGAAIEDGFVILFSTDEGADPIEGIAVVTDGKDRSNLMKNFGWQVSDSSDPRIKHLKRNKFTP